MKQQGDIAEAKFLLECLIREIKISKPFGDNYKYDFITDDKSLKRIQIKSTSRFENQPKASCYKCIVCYGSNHKYIYTDKDVDIVAIYVIPHEAWYVLPIDKVKTKSISLYPHIKGTKSKYEKYRDAWDLL